MSDNYESLIKEARDLIQKRYCKEGHHTVVASALLTTAGKIFSALNVGTYQPSISTCAEIIAIGMALKDDAGFEIKAIVTVRDFDAYIVTPCGKCREYIADYGPNALVMVPSENEKSYTPTPIGEMLPYKYIKKEI